MWRSHKKKQYQYGLKLTCDQSVRKYIIIIIIIIIITLTVIELYLVGISPYSSTNETRINIHKRNNTQDTLQTIQNSVNTNTHITKTPTHTHVNTLQNRLKQSQHKIHTKWNSLCTIKYPYYKVTLMCIVICPQELNRNALHLTSNYYYYYYYYYYCNCVVTRWQ